MKKIDLEKREALESPFFYTYAITDPEYYGDTLDSFEKTLSNVLKNFPIKMICFRDKTTPQIKELAQRCFEISKKHKIEKVLLNGNPFLAQELGFDGVHLTSAQVELISSSKARGLVTYISTHTKQEIAQAKRLGADGVTFSPIFFKENKADPKGCEQLKKIVEEFQEDCFDIFALGGITTKERLEQVKQTQCKGFASISYFFE